MAVSVHPSIHPPSCVYSSTHTSLPPSLQGEEEACPYCYYCHTNTTHTVILLPLLLLLLLLLLAAGRGGGVIQCDVLCDALCNALWLQGEEEAPVLPHDFPGHQGATFRESQLSDDFVKSKAQSP